MSTTRHQIVIIGGGSAGVPVAARLLKKGYSDVAVVEPSDKHYYQPLWTLVGGGCASAATSERSEASVMPKGATWIRTAAAAFRPDDNAVVLDDGSEVEYDVLVVAPGIQLDWHRTNGLSDALGIDGVSSNEYGGYASCPLTTSRDKMLLAEFDYSMQRTPSLPVVNLVKPRRDMWYLKRYGLPFLYWNLMLSGRA